MNLGEVAVVVGGCEDGEIGEAYMAFYSLSRGRRSQGSSMRRPM